MRELTACTHNSEQTQTRLSPSIEWEGGTEVLHLTEELLVFDNQWERESQFSLNDLTMKGPAPLLAVIAAEHVLV